MGKDMNQRLFREFKVREAKKLRKRLEHNWQKKALRYDDPHQDWLDDNDLYRGNLSY